VSCDGNGQTDTKVNKENYFLFLVFYIFRKNSKWLLCDESGRTDT